MVSRDRLGILRHSSGAVLVAALVWGCTAATSPSPEQLSSATTSPARPSAQPSLDGMAPAPGATAELASIAQTVISLDPGERRDVPVDLERATEGFLMILTDRIDDLSASVDGVAIERASEPLALLSAHVQGSSTATVTLENTGQHRITVSLSVRAMTTRVLAVDVTAMAVAGEPVEVDVTLTEATPDDVPTLRLRASDDSEMTLQLTSLGNGRWRTVIQPPAGDSYRLYAAVDGPRPRSAIGYLTVGVAGITIEPGFRERVVRGHDGLVSELILSVTVEAKTQVAATIDGTLVDTAGLEVARAHRQVTLAAGRHEYEISFDGETIGRSRLPGPYRLTNLRVITAGLSIATEIADAGTTAAHDPLDFSHFAVEFDLKSFAARTEDADGDGRFEALVVSYRVHLDEAGRYSVQGELVAGDAQVTGSFVAKDLAAGWNDVEVVFDGGEILAAGVNGPFDVRDVSLTGNRRDDPEATGYLPSAMRTENYAASSFED